MQFPIFRLPLLVVIEVFKSMEAFELVSFSTLSLKYTRIYTKSLPIRLIVSHGRRGCSVTFQLGGNSNSWMMFTVDTEPAPGYAYMWTFDHTRLAVRTLLNSSTIFWTGGHKHPVLGLLIGYFAKRFKVQSISFDLSHSNQKGSVHILQYAKNLKLKFNEVNWKADVGAVEVERKALSLCGDATKLNFEPGSGDGLTFNGFRNFTVDHLRIVNPYWVTVNNLCYMTGCLEVELIVTGRRDIGLSIQELNQFIKKWMDGGRWQYFGMGRYTALDMTQLLEGINATVVVANEQYQIQRSDGKKVMLTAHMFGLRLEVVNE